MADDRFETLDRMLDLPEPEQSLDFLIAGFDAEKNYSSAFQARLMKSRLALGLPLIQTEDVATLPPDVRRVYEEAFIQAARQAGDSYLAVGDIPKAWPYFRALSEPGPVAEAIEKVEPGEGIEPIISIAFQEGVHPAKGLELILAQYGMCRAITSFGMQAIDKGRVECLQLLVRSLHAELVDRMRRVIAETEGTAPETASVTELMAGRDWMFGEYSYYVDTSHLVSVIQYAPEIEDAPTLRLLLELCDYGKHLSSNFRNRGYPPFENTYEDYGKYIEACLGIDVDGAIAHFRRKVAESDPEEVGTAPAQVLVKLLVRLGRYGEALDVAVEHLKDTPASELGCPSPMHICQLAGDYARLMELAREKGDILSYTAAGLSRKV